MPRKLLVALLCLVPFLFYAENLAAVDLQPLPVDSAEFKRDMQEHIEKMRMLKPGKHQDMVERAAGKITNCCSCHVETCDKGAGQVFKK